MSGKTHHAEHFHSACTTPSELPIYQASLKSSTSQTYFGTPLEKQGDTIRGFLEQLLYMMSKVSIQAYAAMR